MADVAAAACDETEVANLDLPLLDLAAAEHVQESARVQLLVSPCAASSHEPLLVVKVTTTRLHAVRRLFGYEEDVVGLEIAMDDLNGRFVMLVISYKPHTVCAKSSGGVNETLVIPDSSCQARCRVPS